MTRTLDTRLKYVGVVLFVDLLRSTFKGRLEQFLSRLTLIKLKLKYSSPRSTQKLLLQNEC